MCGLFGVLSSSLTKSEVENAMFLGMLSSTRGIDSTGIAVLGRGKGRIKLCVHRELGNSMNFILSKETKRALETDNRFAIMGHTRWATIGAVNLRNAHPIEEDGIVLCHNGSIDHFVEDKKSETNSDSRELGRRLAVDPVDAVLRSVGNGAYACTWADFSKGTINLVRNAQRPLSFMLDASNTTLYWASEYWMLKALAYKEGESKFKAPCWFATDKLWSFPFGSSSGKITELDLSIPKPKVEGIIPHHPITMCRFCKKLEKNCSCSKEKTLPMLPQNEFKSMLYRGFDNRTLSIGAVAPRLKMGCASCKKPASPRDKVFWFHSNEFVCSECAENNPTVEDYLFRENKVFESSLVRTQ